MTDSSMEQTEFAGDSGILRREVVRPSDMHCYHKEKEREEREGKEKTFFFLFPSIRLCLLPEKGREGSKNEIEGKEGEGFHP